MTTTPSAGAAGLMWAAPAEALSSAWAGGARKDIGSLPSCRLRRVTEYIQAHLDEDLRLTRLGAVVYMSPYHFARLFQRSTGMPPHRFVVRARIDHATTLLAAPVVSIAGISRAVGFRTPSHFSTVFRRIMGVTPRAYRAAYLRTGLSHQAGG